MAADRCQQATEAWEMKFPCILPAKLALSARGCAQPQETGTSLLAMGTGAEQLKLCFREFPMPGTSIVVGRQGLETGRELEAG